MTAFKNRADNQNRTGISSLEDWSTNHCAISAKLSGMKELNPHPIMKHFKTSALDY